MDKLLTTTEAAALLRIKRNSVVVAITRGLMQGEKLGRDWLVTAGEVERYRLVRKVGRPKKHLKPSNSGELEQKSAGERNFELAWDDVINGRTHPISELWDGIDDEEQKSAPV